MRRLHQLRHAAKHLSRLYVLHSSPSPRMPWAHPPFVKGRHTLMLTCTVTTWIMAVWPFLSSWSGSFILWFNIGFEIPRPTLTSTLLQLVVTGTAWVVRSEVVLAVAHSTVLVLLSGIGAVPVLSREILLWRAAYLASLGACLWVMRAGARHLLWCILGSQGAKHAALASCGVAGKPC